MPIDNKFELFPDTPENSPSGAALVTPSDDDDLPFVSRIVYSGTAGVIQIVPKDNAATMTAVPFTVVAGLQLMVQAVRILATDTTVTGIVILR